MDIRSIQWEEALPIRHKVLWPSKPALFCNVEGDESANHYGVYIKGKLVSVASIYVKDQVARLRKFATLVECQGCGIGSKLLTYILNDLKEFGIVIFWCDARKTAISFYEQFGMTIQGTEFNKSGVSYVKMEIRL